MTSRKISYELRLPEDIVSDLKNYLEQSDRFSQKYPWVGLEEYLENQNENSLKIVGYGSLLNAESASLTFAAKKITPVIAFGVYRIFNYVIPEDNPRYGMWGNPVERAALNIDVTNDVNDFINGALIEVPINEIMDLRKREIAYDLIQVPCILWDSEDQKVFYSFILHCPYPEYDGIEKTSNNLTPHKNYYLVCREGARSFGDEFLKCWKSSSFLGDKISSMDKWESDQPIL